MRLLEFCWLDSYELVFSWLLLLLLLLLYEDIELVELAGDRE